MCFWLFSFIESHVSVTGAGAKVNARYC